MRSTRPSAIVAVGHDVDGQFDQPQREAQPCVYLQVLGYCFHPLPDSVADDQEEEEPTPEVCGERKSSGSA
jgi:hypothetical protein